MGRGATKGYEMSPAPAPVTPLVFHWFYAKAASSESEQQPQQPQQQQQEQQRAEAGRPSEPVDWQPFSRGDSALLEREYQAGTGRLVPVLGRRYDVDVAARSLLPVYWECAPGTVRRCSWFSRGVHEAKFMPYEEHVAEKLEEIYEESSRTGQWHRDVQLGEEGYVVLHSPGCLVHHPGITHAWEEVTMPDDPSRPRQMRRGWNTVEGAGIPADEPELVNHLVFVVHGIGSWCDLKFRKVTECVDDMRTMAAEMARSHFSSALSAGQLGRVEFLPISWHHALHGAAGGLDEALRLITLPSIPLLREFTNDTIVDVLYYTSPIFCQVILKTVGDDINSIYGKFCERNPEFRGSVSVAGHSLGSLILFDLLSNQTGEAPDAEPSSESPEDGQLSEEERYSALLRALSLEQHGDTLRRAEVTDVATLRLLTDQDVEELGLPLGARRRLLHWRDKANNKPGVDTVTVSYDTNTGQPAMHYPQLAFRPACFFGMGSPIALFLRIRGVSQLGAEFRLPTCGSVFNIYHPFDPVSFRIEPLIDAANVRRRPVLVPHHKGRKRMHLEIKEQVVRMGTELKQRLMSSLQSTIGSVYSLGWMSTTETSASVTADMDTTEETTDGQQQQQQQPQQEQTGEPTGPVGSLNGGRRVDYVLQERPFESLNEYVFAFQSHLCYWDSEDTLLMILKETLRESGIEADKVLKTESSTEAEPAAASSTSEAATGTVTAPAAASVSAPTLSAPPVAPIPVVVSEAGPVEDVPLIAAGVPGPPAPAAPAPAPAAGAGGARSVGGRPLQLPPAAGGPVGMDPTVERKEGAAPPPPPPTAGFRRS
ncbi:phospholipase DDHD2-like isoform X3 [Amphibalanus amphitrite]|uniref:phospholipase DDHD2-like isoform X3 n=1 Tax=Amphibalanus amphitrite TaxID=1232801 RepID=UPI001C913D72|nr:phospholipase DDHD2-like isoform X3 [Amphibalanus amphitrite]